MRTLEEWHPRWLVALTRERRKQLATGTLPVTIRLRLASRAHDETRRYAARSYEFEARCASVSLGGRGSKSPVRWRRQQWIQGNRSCGYCGVECLEDVAADHPRKATTDHRKPKALGGADRAINFLMACFRCNNRKGQMTEAEFRALLDAERLAA